MAGPYIEDLFNSITPTTGVNARKAITGLSGGAMTSGGNPTPGFVIGSTTTGSGVGFYTGAGAPTISAPKGSLYTNTTASTTTTRVYVNTDGGTTWASFTASA